MVIELDFDTLTNIQNFYWVKRLPKSNAYPRHWITIKDIKIKFPNGYVFERKKGVVFDGASVPKCLWFILKPEDEGMLADFVHDELWIEKNLQLPLFDYHIYNTRKFADQIRLEMRNKLAPNKKFKNYFTHFVIRAIGGLFYSRQLKIPK